jgi:hypothetical protein
LRIGRGCFGQTKVIPEDFVMSSKPIPSTILERPPDASGSSATAEGTVVDLSARPLQPHSASERIRRTAAAAARRIEGIRERYPRRNRAESFI